MEGRLKYRPSKPQMTLTETRQLLKAYAQENRKLKMIILRMTEQEERDARHGSPSALDH